MREHFGDVLHEYVGRMALTAGRLSKLTGISSSTIESWLEGRVRSPRNWQDIVTVAAALRLSENEATRLLLAAGCSTVAQLKEQAVEKGNQSSLKKLSPWLGAITKYEKPAVTEKAFTVLNLPSTHIPPVTTLPPGSFLPYSPNPFFVGRRPEMKAVAKAFSRCESTLSHRAAALIGIGGIGKSQLAVEFAHRYGHFFTGGVYWINFSDPDTIPEQIGSFYLPNLKADVDQLSLPKKVALVQRAWQEPTPRLLIFDSCEDEYDYLQWRPSTGGCRVIVTSRRGRWRPELGVAAVKVPTLSANESQQLLRHFRHDLAPTETQAVARELGNLPLALHMAGNYLRAYRHEITAEEYLTELKTLQNKTLLDHPSLQSGDRSLTLTGQELHVARTIAQSYGKLQPAQANDELAHALLIRAAQLAPATPIPRALLAATTSTWNHTHFQFADALSRLVNLGLVTEGIDGTVKLHRLVAVFVKAVSPDQAAVNNIEEWFLGCLRELEASLNPATMHICEPHLRHVTNAAIVRQDLMASSLAHYLATYLWLLGLYDEAHQYSEHALRIQAQLEGVDPQFKAECLNISGLLLKEQGLFDDALPLYEEALAIRKKFLGHFDLETAKAMNNLGALWLAMQNLEKAKIYFEQTLEIKERVLGPDHLSTGVTLNNLGCLLVMMKVYDKAQEKLKRALAIDQKEHGPHHPRVGTTLNNLGKLFYEIGSYEEARNYLQQAATILENTLDTDHPIYGKALHQLGAVCHKTGKNEEAESLLGRSLTIMRKKLGNDHPHTAQVLTTLGDVTLTKNRPSVAQSYFTEAHAILCAAYGPDHEEVQSIDKKIRQVAM
ncbi:MAG: tetratricopeptide repeat protein [Ardenticatenaceae bacterium]|nr:tetratricopeptide repeat protein [Ardenticatenaceae bacterium]